MGRFLQQDPVRQGNNWYTYCNNNPLNHTDPDGRVDPDIYEGTVPRDDVPEYDFGEMDLKEYTPSIAKQILDGIQNGISMGFREIGIELLTPICGGNRLAATSAFDFTQQNIQKFGEFALSHSYKEDNKQFEKHNYMIENRPKRGNNVYWVWDEEDPRSEMLTSGLPPSQNYMKAIVEESDLGRTINIDQWFAKNSSGRDMAALLFNELTVSIADQVVIRGIMNQNARLAYFYEQSPLRTAFVKSLNHGLTIAETGLQIVSPEFYKDTDGLGLKMLLGPK